MPLACLLAWLNMLNTELSPKRSWQGQRSQEMGEVSKLVFYTQTTNAVISGKGRWGKEVNYTNTKELHNKGIKRIFAFWVAQIPQ